MPRYTTEISVSSPSLITSPLTLPMTVMLNEFVKASACAKCQTKRAASVSASRAVASRPLSVSCNATTVPACAVSDGL